MESPRQKPPNVARFGVFEADFDRRVFTKRGVRIRLQDQPFKVLGMLLEQPGEIVSREEIRQRLWAADTFVEFDDGLNTAIKKLRAALADSADKPRFIETVPRRGYRFIAQVTLPLPEDLPAAQTEISSTPPDRAGIGWKARVARIAIVFILLAIIGTAWRIRIRPSPLQGTDLILLVDFENSTGEPILDDTLKQATAVELGQSPFLNIVSNDRVRDTLRFMSRPPDDRVPLAIAREVCQRAGAKAYISGSVARLGTGYVLTMRSVSCLDASTLALEKVNASSKEALLPAIDQAAARMRRKLGESLKSIEQFDVPIEEATTRSLEALRAYSLGDEQRARGHEKDSIPFFDHAIELDPKFAMAYARRGAALSNLGETERAATEFKRAYELRENLSEREKFYLTVRYMDTVSGDTAKTMQTFELWHQLYPRDLAPLNGLSSRYQIVGEYEKALAVAQEALAVRPDYYVSYANLSSSYQALNRFDEAKKICAAAAAAKHDSLYTHQTTFEIASLEHDQETLQREIAAAKGTPSEDTIVTLQALTLAKSGKMRLARQMFERSYASRRLVGLSDHAAYTMAAEAVIEADFGFEKRAKKQARESLRLGRGIDAEENAAEALALAGQAKQASSLAEDLHRRFPRHVPLNSACLPTILATIEIRRRNPAKAVQLLQQAIPYDYSEFASLAPVYIRGQAYLRLGAGKEAAAEFQKYLDHRGINASFPRHALALVGLARAFTLIGNTARARKAYEDFFAMWSEADPDIPFLLEARAEYQKLR